MAIFVGCHRRAARWRGGGAIWCCSSIGCAASAAGANEFAVRAPNFESGRICGPRIARARSWAQYKRPLHATSRLRIRRRKVPDCHKCNAARRPPRVAISRLTRSSRVRSDCGQTGRQAGFHSDHLGRAVRSRTSPMSDIFVQLELSYHLRLIVRRFHQLGYIFRHGRFMPVSA